MSALPDQVLHHAPWAVVLALSVSFVSAHTAFKLLHFARHPIDGHVFGWTLLASIACGAGVWATHFIAMLGYAPTLDIRFDFRITALSGVPVIVVTLAALTAAREEQGAQRLVRAGVALGLGIAAMHYVGMAGMQAPGVAVWDPDLVAASIAAGALLAPPALLVSRRRPGRWPDLAAALLLTGATASLHFTGMAALQITAVPEAPPSSSYPRIALAFTIASVVGVLLGLAALARMAERLRTTVRELRERDSTLRLRSVQFDTALNNMTQGLTMYDRDNRLIISNRRYCELTGVAPEVMQPGRRFREVLQANKDLGNFPGVPAEDIYRERLGLVERGTPAVFSQALRNGRIVNLHFQPMASGGWIATFEDVTAQRQAESRVRHMAHHDPLTGLPNRLRFQMLLNEALSASEGQRTVAVLYLDLDRFKEVNDSLGHPFGDALLVAAAKRLRSTVREEDCVARLGGDEFAVIQHGPDAANRAAFLADRLIDAVSAPYNVDGQRVLIGTSVGIALAPDHGTTPEALLKAADLALYGAKAEGGDTHCFFDNEMDARVQTRRQLDLDMRRAFERGAFELFYQPIVGLQSNRVRGLEALLRWRCPVHGLIEPDSFVPLAEETGFITEIGRWSLIEACREAAGWDKDICVAVNLSPRQFDSGTLLDDVAEALASTGLAPERLELEMTEAVLLQDTEETLATLGGLRTLGVSIAMDDFGTGYSSVGYLRKFPFDKVKIDRSFVTGILDDSDALAIVRALIGLGKSFGMATVAEGVETGRQLELLRNEGCDEVQGYYFSMPRPAAELDALLSDVSRLLRAAA